MEKALKCILLVTLLHVILHSRNWCVLGSVIRKHTTYNFWVLSTWLEAREYCRSQSGDLALLTQQSDVDLLNPYIYLSWIGLYKTDGKWKWSDGEPYNNDCKKWIFDCKDYNGDCAAANSTEGRKHQSQDCDNELFFYCSNMDSTVTFVPLATTWENARYYCQRYHKDLVTLENGITAKDLADDDLFYIWTGLHRAQPGADWEWSIGRADYANWEEGSGTAEGNCVGLSNTENNMANLDCNSTWPFYCYFDNLVLVKENKTWEEALEHCRAINPTLTSNNHLSDLISISGPLDHHTVWFRINDATTNEVWTGLRYLAHKWFWVDGTDVPYQDLPPCPDLRKHCGTVDRDNSTIPWNIRDCNEKRNFLCYKTY